MGKRGIQSLKVTDMERQKMLKNHWAKERLSFTFLKCLSNLGKNIRSMYIRSSFPPLYVLKKNLRAVFSKIP